MSATYLPPFSGDVPHPPGYVCGALCTPWCVGDASRPAVPADSAAGLESVPAAREARVAAPTA